MKNKVIALLKSRRFLVSVAGVVAVVASDAFGVSLNSEQLVSIASIVIAWVIGDTVRETK